MTAHPRVSMGGGEAGDQPYDPSMVAHLSKATAAELAQLPPWATLVRAPNPGPMTLDGTNTWVLRAPGAGSAVLVDPGPDDEAHLAAAAGYAPIGLILVTHGHPDHTDGLARLNDLLGGVPVVAAAAPTLDGRAAGALREAGLELVTLPTPGHTADSVSFHVQVGADEVVLTGDTILGRGSAVVAWPDGDLGDYLASLDRLAGLGPIPVLPGHGPALTDCAAAARAYLRHRLARLDQVRAARAAGAADVDEVVAAVYADVDSALRPAARWSVAAQLAYLERDPS